MRARRIDHAKAFPRPFPVTHRTCYATWQPAVLGLETSSHPCPCPAAPCLDLRRRKPSSSPQFQQSSPVADWRWQSAILNAFAWFQPGRVSSASDDTRNSSIILQAVNTDRLRQRSSVLPHTCTSRTRLLAVAASTELVALIARTSNALSRTRLVGQDTGIVNSHQVEKSGHGAFLAASKCMFRGLIGGNPDRFFQNGAILNSVSHGRRRPR